MRLLSRLGCDFSMRSQVQSAGGGGSPGPASHGRSLRTHTCHARERAAGVQTDETALELATRRGKTEAALAITEEGRGRLVEPVAVRD